MDPQRRRTKAEAKAVPVAGALGGDLAPDEDLRALRGRVHRLAFEQSDPDDGRALQRNWATRGYAVNEFGVDPNAQT